MVDVGALVVPNCAAASVHPPPVARCPWETLKASNFQILSVLG